jgi:hypothetical protein
LAGWEAEGCAPRSPRGERARSKAVQIGRCDALRIGRLVFELLPLKIEASDWQS